MLYIITPIHSLWWYLRLASCTRFGVYVYTTILSTVGQSQYIIILTSQQYHSSIAIHYCHMAEGGECKATHTSNMFTLQAYPLSGISNIGYMPN